MQVKGVFSYTKGIKEYAFFVHGIGFGKDNMAGVVTICILVDY